MSRAAIEAFHLAFMRHLLRSVPAAKLAIKGGCNLRFFFGSGRYSEDIDLDVANVPVFELRDKVMRVLGSTALLSTMRSLGIEAIHPPQIARAKQTDTVQRFKVHLLSAAGEDIATKIEFSRRGIDAPVKAETVLPTLTGCYKMPSLIAPHYLAPAAIRQKARALATRRQPEARDIFDLFVLASHATRETRSAGADLGPELRREARERVYAIDFREYRDKVVCFLAPEEQAAYDSIEMWDEIRVVALSLIDVRSSSP